MTELELSVVYAMFHICHRNSVLSNELKTVKQQLQVLTKKGEHDDQLIQALLVRKQTFFFLLLENRYIFDTSN